MTSSECLHSARAGAGVGVCFGVGVFRGVVFLDRLPRLSFLLRVCPGVHVTNAVRGAAEADDAAERMMLARLLLVRDPRMARLPAVGALGAHFKKRWKH